MSKHNDTDDLDFAMFDLPTRPGPCKADLAPEVDPVEKRLEQEREAAPFIAEALSKHSSSNVPVKHTPTDGSFFRIRLDEEHAARFLDALILDADKKGAV